MKIYYQYSYLKRLTPTGGDLINEIGICTALSKFAKVYYSGQLFKPDKKDYGLKEYTGSIKVVKADISIIRANRDVFERCKGIRIWISSPFDKYAFNKADYIGTFTDAWTTALMEGKKIQGLNDGTKWPKAITLHQTLNPIFKPKQYHSLTPKYKEFTIGTFGRLVESNYPYLLFNSLDRIKNLFDVNVIIGVTKLKVVLPEGIKHTKFSYSKMPHAISSCDLIVVNQHGVEWDVCGSLKTLEAMACGVPIILQRSDAREEMFGEDYPLFLDRNAMDKDSNMEDQLIEKIKLIYNNSELNANLSKYVLERSKFYNLENSSKRLKKIMHKIYNNEKDCNNNRSEATVH